MEPNDHLMLEHSVSDCRTIQHPVPCRICGQVGLNSVLACDGESTSAAWTTDLAWCPACSLLQLTDAVSVSKTSNSSNRAKSTDDARSLAHRIRESRCLGSDSLVIELTEHSRDLLPWYHQAGVPVLRISQQAKTTTDAIQTLAQTFDEGLALELARTDRRADVIHVGDEFTQLADLNGVVAGFRTLLKVEGIVVVEVPYLNDLANCVGFNTLDHDVLCYFSLTALAQLFGQHGLEVVDVERLKWGGGMLRVIVAKSGTMSVAAAVHDLMEHEAAWVRDPAFYRSFGETLLPSSHDRWAA